MDNKLVEIKHQIISRLTSSEAFKKSEQWYQALPVRDALILRILTGLAFLALIYAWIIQPAISSIKQAENSLAVELRFHSKLKENAYLFNNASRGSATNKGSILSRVNSLAKAKGIKLKRFEPDGDSGLRVWLEKVNFDAAIDWVETLENEKGIKVEQISIDKVEPGIVNLRAVFKL